MFIVKYKILIFDLDDTLINNTENLRGAFKVMLERSGQLYTDSDFERLYAIDKEFWVNWQDGLIDIPKKLRHETNVKSQAFLDWVRSQRFLIYFNNRITEQRAIELNNVFISALNKSIIEVDGARETLRYLYAKYKILVVTNGPNVAVAQKLKKIGCLQYVAEVFSADMHGSMKPSVEFF